MRAADLWFAMTHSEDPTKEVFAVNCYLDESATDGGTPEAVVAGVLMDRDRFLAFDAEWKGFLAKHNLSPAFHMKDFGFHGRLGGIGPDERRAIFSDAVAIINRHKIYSVAATVNNEDYRRYLDKRIRDVMSVYGLCFILSAYSNHLRAVHNKYEKNIGFLLDSGNPYADHVREAHSTLLVWQKSEPLHAGSLTFASDEDVSALQAADLVAWSVRRRLVNGKFENGFEVLLEIFDEAHSEESWEGTALQLLSDRLVPFTENGKGDGYDKRRTP